MTVSLSVAWALFALAPGLAVFAGLFLSKGRDVVHPSAPAPASLISLAIVVFGALGLHLFGAALFAVNDLMAAVGCLQITVPWTPNVYAYFLAHSIDPTTVGIEAFFLLLTLVSQSLLGFFLTTEIARRFPPNSTFHTFLYGWLSPVLGQLKPEPDATKHLIGYVVTDLEVDTGYVGYEGQVVNLALNAEKQIISITLSNCQAFILRAEGDQVEHNVVPRENPIPRLQIDQAHIRNLALAVAMVSVDIVDPKDGDEAVSVENPTS